MVNLFSFVVALITETLEGKELPDEVQRGINLFGGHNMLRTFLQICNIARQMK
jgi:hypothetical protein